MRKVWRGSWFNRGKTPFLDHKVVEHIAFKSRVMNKDVRQLPHRNA
ncbi:hypothetical protein AC01_2576 [Escherichia coli 1-392-07_S3_C1]|nr:hypothetical protein HMPREF1620_00433 [Escherichia coli 909945-2]EZJ74336.1 hypothetical protein AC57_1559 [Escherichia coli 1-392-07_S3_C3]KDT07648.1 hypothetical protein AC66_1610 [Escherichia coli 2-011-08_S4_C1]KDT21688.1 hypothetical protein AD24_1591 [Escherichia coli 2-011-08_S4_C3]KDT34001.1 hypothetical protein AB17_2312 [Escherichia coli 3-105-05_S1_C1]KDT83581.1 hypothetical protein AB20_3722 [Escherichia coli 3-475-03_S1_C1]KDU53319.1 hypothetical protein AD18_3869 [Escherichia